MIRYAVIPVTKAPETLPTAPVQWEFTVSDVAYIGLEWGDGDKVPKLGSDWITFETPEQFNEWTPTT